MHIASSFIVAIKEEWPRHNRHATVITSGVVATANITETSSYERQQRNPQSDLDLTDWPLQFVYIDFHAA